MYFLVSILPGSLSTRQGRVCGVTPGTDSAALLRDGSRGVFPGEVGCTYEFLVLRVDLLNRVFSCSWRSPGWAGVCHCLRMAEGNARDPRAAGCRTQLNGFMMGLHLPPGFAEQVTLPRGGQRTDPLAVEVRSASFCQKVGRLQITHVCTVMAVE